MRIRVVCETVLLWVAFSAAGSAAGGVAGAPQSDPPGNACFSAVRTARGTDGKPIVLTAKQLDERAIRRVMPKYPALLRQASLVTHGRVKILIGESGRVECASVLYGHPMALPNVVEAIKQWRFRPYTVKGARIPVLGYFDFCFSTSGCPFMDLGRPAIGRPATELLFAFAEHAAGGGGIEA